MCFYLTGGGEINKSPEYNDYTAPVTGNFFLL